MTDGEIVVNSATAAKTILHVIDTTGPGGAETVFIELADRLRARGYRSVVVIRGKGWVDDQLQKRGITAHILPAKGSFNWRFLKGLLRIIKEENVDVIQSHLLGSNVYCGIAGLLARKRVIATFHGMVDVNPNERFRFLKLMFLNMGVTRFVAVSKSLRDAIHHQGLLNAEKCEVIYNGVDLSRYGKSDSVELRIKFGLPADAVLVGSLGNIRPAKGYDLLIQAARNVVDAFPGVHFVIAGDPKTSLQASLNSLVEQLGLAAHVHFVGFCDDSAGFLAQLDYFLLSSTSEGLSIATIEALATGLPAVVTRCGGPEEIIDTDSEGVMVEAKPTEIAQAVMRLMRDPELAKKLAATGKESTQRRFDIEVMLDAYVQLYE